MKLTRRAFIPLVCALPSGCVLFKQENQPALIAFVASRAGEAATIAVAADIKANPQHRAAYETAILALDGLMQQPGYSSAEFKATLAALPIKEFHGTQGALVLEGAVLVFDLLTMFAYDVDSAPALLAVSMAVRDGIAQGLTFEDLGSNRVAIRNTAKPTAAPRTVLVARKTIRI